MLVGGARRGHEQLVAAGTVARALAEISPSSGWALALGRRRIGRAGQLSLPLTRAVPLTLLPATFLAVPAGAVALAGPPTPPATGCLLTAHTAIATLRLRRPEPPFTALEQAPPAAVGTVSAARAFLTWTRKVGKLLRAHGRECSRVVKPRGEVVIFPPRRLCPSPVGVGEEARVTPPLYPAVSQPAPSKGREPVCARPRADWLRWLCESGSLLVTTDTCRHRPQ
jgi:hypothetical protein